MSGYPKPYGRYVLQERIAMGGMAEIFRAHTATLGFQKRVCIKRVLPHFLEDEEFVTMFRDEARTAAKLQHANVVQVFDFGTEDGALYLAMELIDGADLRHILETSRKKRIPFEIGEAVQIAIDMCRGLHHAHTLVDNGRPLRLVHRDISPHNVLVSLAGEVKVTDFGIARAAERATHTSTGVVKGKVAYMAPEQAQGLPFDHRLDQFATGVVLWEMLVGARLFTGENDIVILKKVLECDVPSPSALRKDVPGALDDIVNKALARHPSDRFADMRHMELALARFMFSGAIDQATAEVRNLFTRIMSDSEAAHRKTQIAQAPAPALNDANGSSSVDISLVFTSNDKLSTAHLTGPLVSGVDANALTALQQGEHELAALGPSLSPVSFSVRAQAGARLVSTEPIVPSPAEPARVIDASAVIEPAPDATPATRTNVPPQDARPAALAGVTDAIRVPARAWSPRRKRALLVAAGGVLALAAAAFVLRFTARAPVPEMASLPRIDAVPAAPRPDATLPFAVRALEPVPLEAAPRKTAPLEDASLEDAPLQTRPLSSLAAEPALLTVSPTTPAEERPATKRAQVQVLVKASGRWVYFVRPNGEKLEIYSDGTPMTLPEGKGKFRVITQDGKDQLVPLEVRAGATLLLPSL